MQSSLGIPRHPERHEIPRQNSLGNPRHAAAHSSRGILRYSRAVSGYRDILDVTKFRDRTISVIRDMPLRIAHVEYSETAEQSRYSETEQSRSSETEQSRCSETCRGARQPRYSETRQGALPTGQSRYSETQSIMAVTMVPSICQAAQDLSLIHI